MLGVKSNVIRYSRPAAWPLLLVASVLVLAVGMLASGAWGGNVHAATLNDLQGKGEQQTQGKGSNPDLPDDVPYLINESFLGDNLAASVFYPYIASCVPGNCTGWRAVANYWSSPARSAMAAGPAGVADQQLILGVPVQIPANAITVTLEFQHYYNFEATQSTYFDGGVLEVSTDNGNNWSDSSVQFISGGYNATISSSFNNPLAGRQAWGGMTQTYQYVKANLLAFAGEEVLIRFREGSDSSNASLGWSVDDIRLTVNTPTPCAQRAWSLLTPYTLPVAGPASVVFNGRLYLFGGRNTSHIPATESYRYNPLYDSWIANAPMPQGRSGFTAVTDGTYIYLLGGYDGSGAVTGTFVRYNPNSNSYQTLTAAPHIVAGHGAVIYGNRIFRIGGYDNSNQTVSSVDIYDINTNTWSAGPDYPISAASMAVVANGYYIYTMGGYTQDGINNHYVDKTYRLNPSNNTWEDAPIADLPQSRAQAAAGVLNGRIVLAGGSPSDLATTSIYWDPASNSWSNLPDMSAQAISAGYGVIGQTLYVAAGQNQNNLPQNTTQQLHWQECVAPTPTVTATPIACSISFSDVPQGSTFYSVVRCLACRGIISGYGDGTFRPSNDVTRGQIAKIVSNAAGFSEVHNTQSFQDISTAHTFYQFIERLASRNIISGYACGGTGEPCVAPNNLPYFRSNSNASRGQLAKITCKAYNCSGVPSGQSFQDVAIGSTFYTEIEQLYALGAISGYACGGTGEPCVAPNNRPYFRPGANVSRGQTAKIVANAFFPNCQTP